jgi:hypothetical protein
VKYYLSRCSSSSSTSRRLPHPLRVAFDGSAVGLVEMVLFIATVFVAYA